ncbi:MAG: hypothetical protein HY901_06200 [Deltaproteobacteria bacterium]|nr:hypothetical protein [Deltaproteobacteria bacterium]
MSEPLLDDREVALRVARALEAAGIEYALGGSVASGIQGEPRATNDVDFAVRLAEHQVAPLAKALGPEFVVDQEGLREAARHRRSDNIFFLPSAFKIDLFVRGGEPFDDSELSRRRLLPIRGEERAWVATPEDNILRKLAWFRKGGEVSDRQWRDVLGILRLPGQTIDWGYLRRWSPRLGVEDLLQRAERQA